MRFTKGKHLTRYAVLTSIVLTASLLLMPHGTAPSSAAAERDGVLSIEFSKGEVAVTDETGAPLLGLSSDGDPAQETLDGETSSGMAARVVVLSASNSTPTQPLDDNLESSDTNSEPNYIIPEDYEDEVVTFSAEEIPFDESSLSPTFAYGFTENAVTFAWATENGTNYSVIKDDQPFADGTGTAYTDNTVQGGASYIYEIVVSASPTEVGLARSWTISISISDVGEPDAVTPLAYQSTSTAFVHKTFIQPSRVPLNWYQNIGCGSWPWSNVQHGGDNRSYVTPTTSVPGSPSVNYRTMMWAVANWNSGNLSLGKGVGPSRLYGNGVLRETRYTSMSEMLHQNPGMASSYAEVRFNHKAGNPYCNVGKITYNEVVRFYRNGTVQVVGWRYPVPHHEAYARFNNGSGWFWKTVFRRPNSGFDCLTGSCGSQTLNYTVTS